MPDIRNAAALYIDTADTFAQLSLNHSDYMHHIVSHFAAERMKHVKHYLEGGFIKLSRWWPCMARISA